MPEMMSDIGTTDKPEVHILLQNNDFLPEMNSIETGTRPFEILSEMDELSFQCFHHSHWPQQSPESPLTTATWPVPVCDVIENCQSSKMDESYWSTVRMTSSVNKFS